MAKDTIYKNNRCGKKVCNFRRQAKIAITWQKLLKMYKETRCLIAKTDKEYENAICKIGFQHTL